MMRLFVFALVSCAVVQLSTSIFIKGGLTETKPADETITKMVTDLEPEIGKKLGKDVDDIQVISYRSQVVLGMNYYVKVQVGDDYAHLKIYRDLDGNTSLWDYQTGKSANDEIVEF